MDTENLQGREAPNPAAVDIALASAPAPVAGTDFPAGLVEWAGNHKGGVRRLFDDASGRPTQSVIKTHLLTLLQTWASSMATDPEGSPRIVLLVGGPGNGKTEAIERTLAFLDQSLGASGTLELALREQVLPRPGEAVPRVARARVPLQAARGGRISITLVQDASIEEDTTTSRAAMLVRELGEALWTADDHRVYLGCVNRGVLDEAVVESTEHGPEPVRDLLVSVASAVSQGATGSCWPLERFPEVAAWPLDVESLLIPSQQGGPAPVDEIIEAALDPVRWPAEGSCNAGALCPFCGTRKILSNAKSRAALVSMLRWHELSTGKRWTFRDLFSLFSHLLAGVNGATAANTPPCKWAAALISTDSGRQGQKPTEERSTAIFKLAGSFYQHKLFSRWDARVARWLREDLRELALLTDHTAMGLYYTLRGGSGSNAPTTIAHLLDTMCDALDPALASPATEAALNSSHRVELRDLDARFSQSVAAGLEFLARHRSLTRPDTELLGRLAELDRYLSVPEHRRKRPDAASRVQHMVRDFACRWARRSVCARSAVTRDSMLLEQYQGIVEAAKDNVRLLFEAAREISQLLNAGENFEVSLTTTFGQPLPPPQLRAMLVTSKKSVRPGIGGGNGRPWPEVHRLRVGRQGTEQYIPLTFDLYRSVRLLADGMSPASLSREAVALIDTTRARLGGSAVRDPDELGDSNIVLGDSVAAIAVIGGRFVPTGGGRR